LAVAAGGLVAGVASRAAAQDEVAQLRFLSSAIRDRLPSSAEARRFHAAKDKDAELDAFVSAWLASPEHEDRVRRYFHDMFGIEPYVFIADAELDLTPFDPAEPGEAPADLSEAGAWYLPKAVKATCGPVVDADAWWTEDPIRICTSATSAVLQFDLDSDGYGEVRCTDAGGANGIRHAQCGCGPEQIACRPSPTKNKITAGVALEFRERGLAAYEGNRPWGELFGGDDFYGDRWLYHHYLWQQRVVPSALAPTAAELAVLHALPTTQRIWIAHPSGSPERAGVATSPSFLTRFNNFRSRVRALTNELLCKDVDGSLNVDDYHGFLNPDLSDFDREHGNQASCATCHYSLDNFGSTLLNWNDGGYYEAWDVKSQVGHVFGIDGAGPRFLVDGYVQRASGFDECMAKKAWESFTGAAWDGLQDGDRAAFVAAAADGPRTTIRTILRSEAIRALRKTTGQTVTTTVPVVYDFQDDVAPILEKSCAGSACHSKANDAHLPAYAASESEFKKAAGSRIADGTMPPVSSGKSLTAAEKKILLIFLNQ
jgi:hypothetical protein